MPHQQGIRAWKSSTDLHLNSLFCHKEDSSDDKFLECAVEGGADYLISTDRHILALKEVLKTKIVKPAEFMRIIGGDK